MCYVVRVVGKKHQVIEEIDQNYCHSLPVKPFYSSIFHFVRDIVIEKWIECDCPKFIAGNVESDDTRRHRKPITEEELKF